MEKQEYVNRLKELREQHAVRLDEDGPNPGFIEDEMVTRQSYRLVRSEAIRSGQVSEAELAELGLPEILDQPTLDGPG